MQVVHPTRTDLAHSDTTANLKRIMAGVTMDTEGCVLAGQMLAGNTSDVKWNATWGAQLDQDFPEDFWKGTCYIAGSAIFSDAAIQQIRQAGMSWLGRLAVRFALCGALKMQAWDTPEAWESLESIAASGKSSVSTYQARRLMSPFSSNPPGPWSTTRPLWTRKKSTACNGKSPRTGHATIASIRSLPVRPFPPFRRPNKRPHNCWPLARPAGVPCIPRLPNSGCRCVIAGAPRRGSPPTARWFTGGSDQRGRVQYPDCD